MTKKKKHILKKRIKLLLCSVYILVILININCITKLVKERNYEAEYAEPSSLIVNQANADQEFIDALVSQIDMVPDYIVNCFADNEGVIIITNGDLRYIEAKEDDKIQSNTNIEGLIHFTNNTIYIRNDNNILRDYAVVHEFGHYADKMYYWPSLSKKFEKIYKKEKDLIQTNALIDSESELFAEAFKKIIVKKDNDNLESYEYVKKFVKLY